MEQDIFNLEAENKKVNAEQRRERVRELSDLKRILKLPEGRRFIWKLWSKCGIFRNPFNLNSNLQSFNSGRMSIGQELLGEVTEVNPSAFSQCQNEHMSAAKSKKEATNG